MNEYTTHDWTQRPEIKWEKVICPICHQPTGKQSICHKLPKEKLREILNEDGDQDVGFRRAIETDKGLMPILSEPCIFRQYNRYLISTNFPLSQALITNISKVPGVEYIMVISKYRAEIIIAELFDEKEVRRKIQQCYEAYINYAKFQIDKLNKRLSKDLNNKVKFEEIDFNHTEIETILKETESENIQDE